MDNVEIAKQLIQLDADKKTIIDNMSLGEKGSILVLFLTLCIEILNTLPKAE